jgi:hypothetical protein
LAWETGSRKKAISAILFFLSCLFCPISINVGHRENRRDAGKNLSFFIRNCNYDYLLAMTASLVNTTLQKMPSLGRNPKMSCLGICV